MCAHVPIAVEVNREKKERESDRRGREGGREGEREGGGGRERAFLNAVIPCSNSCTLSSLPWRRTLRKSYPPSLSAPALMFT